MDGDYKSATGGGNNVKRSHIFYKYHFRNPTFQM
jgi:hypothetical protein